MDIVLAPDPILRQVCEPCEVGDKSLKKLAKEMAKTMYKNEGVGLAAPQVGVLKRIIVVDCDIESSKKNPVVLINPEIVDSSGDVVIDGEGCLSCPGITVPIARASEVRVRYFDLDGSECEMEADGLWARCIQHEIDHLDGKTLFESASPLDRLQALQDYDVALAAGAKPGETSVKVR
ncbi:MAG: peptide deformylase [Eggerthellaceae bacterium]|nr:peptide deformylase [Eggerthellaceae bacterium]